MPEDLQDLPGKTENNLISVRAAAEILDPDQDINQINDSVHMAP